MNVDEIELIDGIPIMWVEGRIYPYIVIDGNSNDEMLAKMLQLSYEDYRKILQEQFNAFFKYPQGLYFENEKDAKLAIEWCKSQYVIHKLAEVVS